MNSNDYVQEEMFYSMKKKDLKIRLSLKFEKCFDILVLKSVKNLAENSFVWCDSRVI